MLHRRVHTRGAETDTSIGNVVGIARTSGLRHPGSLQSDPVKRADPPTTGIRGLVRRLARVLALAEEMLASYFLECRKELLAEWLDGLGIEHEKGSLKEEAPTQPDGSKLVWASNRYYARRGETNVFIADWVE